MDLVLNNLQKSHKKQTINQPTSTYAFSLRLSEETSYGVMAQVLVCGPEVNEFTFGFQTMAKL